MHTWREYNGKASVAMMQYYDYIPHSSYGRNREGTIKTFFLSDAVGDAAISVVYDVPRFDDHLSFQKTHADHLFAASGLSEYQPMYQGLGVARSSAWVASFYISCTMSVKCECCVFVLMSGTSLVNSTPEPRHETLRQQ